jgi:hypothetical protein
LPSALEEEPERKHFTNGKDDKPSVAGLHRRKNFEERFGAVDLLSYSSLGWGSAEARAVAAVIAEGAALKLQDLNLDDNLMGAAGARALARRCREQGR